MVSLRFSTSLRGAANAKTAQAEARRIFLIEGMTTGLEEIRLDMYEIVEMIVVIPPGSAVETFIIARPVSLADDDQVKFVAIDVKHESGQALIIDLAKLEDVSASLVRGVLVPHSQPGPAQLTHVKENRQVPSTSCDKIKGVLVLSGSCN
ncbi:hypothetical protein AUEXF2481DRAFT_652908 [Aureobasidium subglaciale EXF-2481]|uniref:Uncharacterized protein n=1 Tax=Aureobasidium subglaciale (strain EXF-2481) TaxID=1043005 RepID=A0A074YDT5_AURSE|nr:uncharacterized protein AUEXF2481DRAFT_652908 [Aureobasidium subglaciale EXF-2481]KEQ95915.1 hypothetical protein AUEXF2481DRAFT_652908 [Aureobasidium subglaciale EXF-2481]